MTEISNHTIHFWQHGTCVVLINCGFTFISLFFQKILVHSANGTESSAATTSGSVELLVLSFCLLEIVLAVTPSLLQFGFISKKWSAAGVLVFLMYFNSFLCLNFSNIFLMFLFMCNLTTCSFLRIIKSSSQVIMHFITGELELFQCRYPHAFDSPLNKLATTSMSFETSSDHPHVIRLVIVWQSSFYWPHK